MKLSSGVFFRCATSTEVGNIDEAVLKKHFFWNLLMELKQVTLLESPDKTARERQVLKEMFDFLNLTRFTRTGLKVKMSHHQIFRPK